MPWDMVLVASATSVQYKDFFFFYVISWSIVELCRCSEYSAASDITWFPIPEDSIIFKPRYKNFSLYIHLSYWRKTLLLFHCHLHFSLTLL